VDVVDNRVVDYADRVGKRIRDRKLYRACESWNSFAIGNDQRRGCPGQRASERGQFASGLAYGANEPESHHQVAGFCSGSAGFSWFFEPCDNFAEPYRTQPNSIESRPNRGNVAEARGTL
jgi:hypothetical protein